jgi:hypothetical protein
MPLADLSEAERDIVRECLRAAVEGSFFPEWEFHTLFGIDREELRVVLNSWPMVAESNESVILAVNNSLNNLLGYPTTPTDQEWPKFISANRQEVKRIFDKWRGEKIEGYFDGIR